MGEHQVNININNEARANFIRHLLDDIKALEFLLEHKLIESDIIRIGAEQEFCLINENWRPSVKAMDVLNAVNDPHFTTELARYNLEINLDPFELKGDCFSRVEKQLTALLNKARLAAKEHQNRILLTGILPTITKNELQLDFMTPHPRYRALNNMLRELRGSDFNLNITGVDELTITHNSVLFEACNTSFQMHLQIAPDDFIASYNWAQAISGPVLGICANSPLLLGRELWSETRIALFKQSIDTRSSSYALKDQQARVTFGDSWASGNIADIFKHEMSRYKVILAKDIQTNSVEELEKGRIPKLPALCLHNGTIYRWNRPCYGVGGGKAHVRIENRYIPAGPSIIDEMANFAFWVGLMRGRPAEFDHMPSQMDFRDAKSNFIKAAKTGKESMLKWMGKPISVSKLVLNTLLPIAYEGLEKSGIDKSDINRLLSIIEKRVAGNSGTQWMVKNYRQLRRQIKQDDALLVLTKNMYTRQLENKPVHEWPEATPALNAHEAASLVGHIMSTQLFTVNENDLAELATSVMLWKNIHHVPVEDNSGRLTGLLTWTHMKRFREKQGHSAAGRVAEIMTRKVLTAQTDTKIKDAIALMKKNEIGCLPVVQDDHLVGIITIKDLLPFDHGESAQ